MVYSLPANLHVLLIDGQGNLDGFHRSFRTGGVKTTLTHDGERGYARAIALRPDVILLGLPLKKGNGMAMLQMLKANAATAEIPVLVVSDGLHPQERLDAFRYGAVDCILLPAKDGEVRARIAIHLGLAGRNNGNPQLEQAGAKPSDAANAQDEDDILVNAARMHVRDHLAEIPNTRTIAHRLDVSDRRLIEAFRRCLNMTPFEYLRKERMQRAEVLLKSTSLPLQALAAEVGYSSAANFVTAFREYHGMPPAQYRREKMAPRARRGKADKDSSSQA